MKLAVGLDEVGRVSHKASLAQGKYIIGLDEVGRGPLAGPVVVCAVLIPKNLKIKHERLGWPKDSKKLTEKQRAEWGRFLRANPRVQYAIAKVEPRVIDKINISAAANLAAWRAYRELFQVSRFKIHEPQVLLDGGLYLKKKGFVAGAKTVVKGDQKIPAISMASIIAKVYRDNLMDRLANKHPGYGFEIHKGYGTKKHYAALKKMGLSAAHRRSFLQEFHGKIKA